MSLRNNVQELRRNWECEACSMPLSSRQRFCDDCTTLNAMVDVAMLPRSQLLNRAENCIYAIGPASLALPVKIGISTFVLKRFGTLQSSSPLPLFVFAVMRCPSLYEKKIHAALSDARVHGEWFNRTERVMDLIRVLRQDDLPALSQWLAEGPTQNQRLDSGCSLER